MLADEEFNVTAIISWNLNSEEKETLYKHLRCFFSEEELNQYSKFIEPTREQSLFKSSDQLW
jgi:hypothetical protein